MEALASQREVSADRPVRCFSDRAAAATESLWQKQVFIQSKRGKIKLNWVTEGSEVGADRQMRGRKVINLRKADILLLTKCSCRWFMDSGLIALWSYCDVII